MKRAAPTQMDLLDWQPPAPVVAFERRTVQAASIAAELSKAVAQTLKDHALSRDKIAVAMGQYLGREVRVSTLNAWASESRADHVINLVSFIALLAVTGDQRLLNLIAGRIGCAVIERRWLKLIDLAALQEREAEIRAQANALRRAARAEGTL